MTVIVRKGVKYKVLPVIPITQGYWDELMDRIKAEFRKKLYGPMLKKIKKPVSSVHNAIDDALIAAIKSGRVVYHRGRISGKFSAQISREIKRMGGTWDKKTSSFRLPKSQMPAAVKRNVASANEKFQKQTASILKELNRKKLPEEIAKGIKAKDIFDLQLGKVDNDTDKSLKNITVPAKLTYSERAKLSREWQNNLRIWIKDFAKEEIQSLRETVKQNVFEGGRYEGLIEGIQSSYGVTSRKARFLARQESNLLLAKFKETKYQSAGVYEYVWECVAGSPAHPVRPSHLALKGTVQRFDKPPITTGPGEPVRRNNPGEDYGCRCNARPIVRF